MPVLKSGYHFMWKHHKKMGGALDKIVIDGTAFGMIKIGPLLICYQFPCRDICGAASDMRSADNIGRAVEERIIAA